MAAFQILCDCVYFRRPVHVSLHEYVCWCVRVITGACGCQRGSAVTHKKWHVAAVSSVLVFTGRLTDHLGDLTTTCKKPLRTG